MSYFAKLSTAQATVLQFAHGNCDVRVPGEILIGGPVYIVLELDFRVLLQE